MWITLLIIFACSFLAFSISAICGGGAGLMLIPILGNLLPINQVPAALSIGTFTSSASRIIIFKKNIRWDIVKFFVPPALPAVWLGAWLLKFVNPIYLEIAMGLFLVSNLPFVFRKSQKVSVIDKPKNITLVLIGFMAGFLSGLTGAVGLLFNKFYLRYGLIKEEIVATRAANEVILHLVKIVLYTLFGLISLKVVYVGVVVAISAILSTWSMKWVLPKLSELLFKKIGYFAMVVSGLVMLSQSGSDLFTTNRGALSANPMSNGIEAKLRWQNANYALEFTYDESFEFEQVIPMSDLTPGQQNLVRTRINHADKIVLEAVYGIGKQTYEAYYFNQNRLIDKFSFQ
ncbi:sulfite exporter TauE/SafE family protein [Emticicia sp. TH156]|uniref:sulfite exporter TauE/SafE family protein n=1 Tax=Emticicia sp. TH156 TaxID=2067454 RepID=UPI000C77DE95|nr:sulfite exporter TauE/SafE family protein [Emticicia sp. TH156]PLK44935.1 hypothetical protein C0V77_06730 [Emticicia sp. TH156]